MNLEGARAGKFSPETSMDHVPIWGCHSLSLAAQSHVECGDKSNEKQWVEDLESLCEALKWFKVKWKIAGLCFLILVENTHSLLRMNFSCSFRIC